MKTITTLFILFFINSCQESNFKLNDCIQKADEIIVYQIDQINNKEYSLKNTQTNETLLSENLNGFIKTSCP